MGCGSLSRPEPDVGQGITSISRSTHPSSQTLQGDGVMKPANSQPSRTSSNSSPRATAARSSSRTALKKLSSSVEGRHGFVPSFTDEQGFAVSAFAHGHHGKDEPHPTRSSRPSHEGGGKHLEKRASMTEGLNHALHALIGKFGGDNPDEDDQLPDLVVDVVFIFKKALEVKNDMLISTDNLSDAVKTIVKELDPDGTGYVTRARLVGYIQSTCVFSNMMKPTHDQVVQQLKPLHLDKHETLSTTAITDGLLALSWGLLPAAALQRHTHHTRTSSHLPEATAPPSQLSPHGSMRGSRPPLPPASMNGTAAAPAQLLVSQVPAINASEKRAFATSDTSGCTLPPIHSTVLPNAIAD